MFFHYQLLLLTLFWSLPLASGQGYRGKYLPDIRDADYDSEFNSETLDARHGFKAHKINDMLEDHHGYLWLATEKGIYLYNGVDFKVFNRYNAPGLPALDCRVLTEDNAGRVWVGTTNGLCRISDFNLVPIRSNEHPVDHVHSLCKAMHSHGVWVGTEKGLYHFDSEGEPEFWTTDHGLADHQVLALADLDNRKLAVGTRRGFQFFDKATRVFSPLEIPEEPWAGDPLDDPYQTAVGDLLITRRGDLFALFGLWPTPTYILHKRENGKWNRFFSDLNGVHGHELTLDVQDGNLFWVLGANHFKWIDPRDSLAREVHPNQLLNGDYITTFDSLSVQSGIFATLGKGLTLVGPKRFKFFNEDHGFRKGDQIATLALDEDGSLLAGGNTGVYTLNHANWMADGDEDLIERNRVRSLYVDASGNHWKGATTGLFVRDKGHAEWTVLELGSRQLGYPVQVLFEDMKNRIWIGTSRGAVVVQSKAVIKRFDADVGIPQDDIRSIAEDASGAVWLASWGGGAVRIAPDLAGFEWYDESNSLVSNYLTTVVCDASGTLWVGGDKGLMARIQERWLVVNGVDYLPERIVAMIEDRKSRCLWIATGTELAQYRISDLYQGFSNNQPYLPRMVITQREGLNVEQIQGEYNQPSLCIDDQGSLWIAAGSGVFSLNASELNSDSEMELQAPVIESVALDGRVAYGMTPSDGLLMHSERLFKGTARVVEATFHTPILNRNGLPRYKVLLEGYDSDWVPMEFATEVRYTNLDPGHYTLRIASSMPLRPWVEAKTPFSFRIQPKWRQASWFMPSMVLFCLMMIWAFYRWRLGYVLKIAELEKRNELNIERARISRDLHDDLGGHINQLSYLLDDFDWDADKAQSVRNPSKMASFRRLVHDLQISLRELMWSTSPKSQHLESIVFFLVSMIQNQTRDMELQCSFDLPDRIPDIEMDNSMQRQLVLIFREALSNALRHSKAEKIHFALQVDSSQLTWVFADNGKGFNLSPLKYPENTAFHQGITNMNKRARQIGAVLSFKTAPGEGCQINLGLPLSRLPQGTEVGNRSETHP